MKKETAYKKLGLGLNSNGFTLIEIMLALGILAFGILAIASMEMSALNGTASAQRVTEAMTIAQDRVEKFVALSYTDSLLSPGTHNDTSPPAGYTVSWTVINNSPVNNTKTINVTVSWTEKGANKSATISYIKMDVI